MPASASSPFDITPRTRIVFGPGTLPRLGVLARELGGSRALLVTDRGIVAAGHGDRAIASMRDAGLQVTLFDSVRENPTTLDVDRCLTVAREAQVDLIVGLGGGSSMDTAKGANFLLSNGGAMRDYWGVGKATRPMLPLIAIPTTAGTGSECQSAALIADEITHQKMACLDPKAAARIALLDPELTVSQPRRVTAVTGIDALAHSLETSVTRPRNPLSSLYSAEAFRLTIHALPRVLSDPNDLAARSHMLLGAAFAGTAIELSMLGAAHASANPLTALFNVVHGAAVGLMLPGVIRFNAVDPVCREIYAQLARNAALAGTHLSAAAAVDALVDSLIHTLNLAEIPADLAQAGGDPQRIPELAQSASRQWTGGFNPRTLTPEDFEDLYREVTSPRRSS
jgi:alcohol dehydrogenase